MAKRALTNIASGAKMINPRMARLRQPSAGMPVKNGATYQIEWPDTGEKSSLDIVTVPGTPGDLVGAAQVLIEHGCQKQLDLLVDSASKIAKQ